MFHVTLVDYWADGAYIGEFEAEKVPIAGSAVELNGKPYRIETVDVDTSNSIVNARGFLITPKDGGCG